ncbi:MAG: S8 family peptidase [Promethearchaeota archaeon]
MRTLVKFNTVEDKLRFLDEHGYSEADDRVLISVQYISFRLYHNCEDLPILILECTDEDLTESEVSSILSAEKIIIKHEHDELLYLSVLSIREILDIDCIDSSIYGPFDGEGVILAIIDGGIDDGHPDLKNKVLFRKRFLAGDDDDDKRPEMALDGMGIGHGTAVAGIICGSGATSNGRFIGMAPAAGLIDCIAFNDEGIGTVSAVISATDWAIKNDAKVICMPFTSEPDATVSEIFGDFLRARVINDGVLVCTGAGNFGPAPSTIGMPGVYDCVITTGSIERPGKLMDESGRGVEDEDGQTGNLKPEFCLPGKNIISLNLFYSRFKDIPLDENEYYAFFSGNSMSVAILSGLVAKVLTRNPAVDLQSIKELFHEATIPMPEYELNESGFGLLSPKLVFHLMDKLHAPVTNFQQLLKDTGLFTAIIVTVIFLISYFIAEII